jgi:hypothetical protein
MAGLLAATTLVLGCKNSDKTETPASAEPARTTNRVATQRMAIETYRSNLLQARPRLDQTIAAANQMVAQRSTNPTGTAAQFRNELALLRGNIATMREQADLLQHLGYNEFFLDADRRQASIAQAEVIEARERFGLVGDYMVSLRREAMLLNDQLTAIDNAIGATPTAASIESASRMIGDLNRDRVKVENLIDLLVKSIDEARLEGAPLRRG